MADGSRQEREWWRRSLGGSMVRDLRTTLLHAFTATTLLAVGLYTYVTAPDDVALLFVACGALLWIALADGIQRRWRGDPRTRTDEPDARTLATRTVTLGGLAVAGLASSVRGIATGPSLLLAGGGLVGAAYFWRQRRQVLAAEAADRP